MFLFGQMAQEQEKWDDAISAWRQLVSKYPQIRGSLAGAVAIAWNVENKLLKLDDALKEYRKVTYGSAQPLAKMSVGRLTAKQMQISTERIALE